MQQTIRAILILSLAVWAILGIVALAVALSPIVITAAFAYAGYAILVLAWREIVPPGREWRNLEALRSMLGFTDIITVPSPILATVAAEAALMPIIPPATTGDSDTSSDFDSTDMIADLIENLDASPEANALRRAAAAAVLADDSPSMAETLRIASMPTDAYTLPELPCVAVLPPADGEIPTVTPTPRKVTAKPLPMPTAARSTAEPLYVRRSGGRYSKVGGRITPRKGESLYRYDSSARGGRGGYVEA